ncbi:3-oxoacyl-[acyl-carrier-protein] reductase FabG [Mycena venus]|uniref:3-oxoacyl-[acyl-carrier-protein] reductase FabG n=1 Tax=Mycena venus TaxID=2733690 RepID=A0A8H6XFC4_9AGAR|nr:3-oxoacyl-[acyl-carrier-protein] reductase FabG [Mycena venus]
MGKNSGLHLRQDAAHDAGETFEITIKIHVCAPFRLIRQAAPYFCLKMGFVSTIILFPCPFLHPFLSLTSPDACENRSIINVSTTSGLHGNVRQANYATAKAA